VPPTSIAEILDGLLEHPRRAVRFVVLVASSLGTLVVAVCLTLFLLKKLEILPDQATLEGVEVHFTNEQVADKKRSYFFVVHAQGWQETPVRLNKGDLVEINAAGSITIDMWSINAYSTGRDNIDHAIRQLAIVRKEWKNDSTPEQFYDNEAYSEVMRKALEAKGFTQNQFGEKKRGQNLVQLMKPKRGWTGPKGYEDDPDTDTAYPARQLERVSVNYPYGALLGAIAKSLDNNCSTERVLKSWKECVPKSCPTEKVLKFSENCIPDKNDAIFAVPGGPQPAKPESNPRW
jgi:hypothetical protein